MPRVSLKRYRPGPKRKREFTVPGQSVQVDVKHVKLESGRYYQFTAIDEATRFRVLRLYDHDSVASAIRFVDEVRKQLPIAIHRIQTDNGSEFGTDFTWHLHDLPSPRSGNSAHARPARLPGDQWQGRAQSPH